jgi:hypothetical protein
MTEIKIKLLAIAKNEAANLPQWIFHHLRLGVDSIDVYINDSTDNSIEISRKINAFEPRYKYHKADRHLERCIKKGENFQKYIYNRAFKKYKKSAIYTHLLILDLDEYLMPETLEYSLKDLILSSENVSVITFPWCIDAPDDVTTPPFHKFICPTMNLRPHKLVKSIGRINNIKKVLPHGFMLKSNEVDNHNLNQKSRILSNGTSVNRENSSIHGSILGDDLRRMFEENISKAWFTFHRVNKSEVEYLASLLKGRPSKLANKSFNSLLKNNREGYILFNSTIMLQKAYSDSSVQNYYSDYSEFIDQSQIKQDLQESQGFILEQLDELNSLIKKNPSIIDTFKKQFAGTRYAGS